MPPLRGWSIVRPTFLIDLMAGCYRLLREGWELDQVVVGDSLQGVS